MTLDFYYSPLSAPCRSILLLCKTLGIELNLKEIDILGGEHLKPEFLKINYQHTIPTLVDNGFTMWESRSILAYLVEKYGKDDSLYPTDPQKRALVNQKLYFDMGVLYQRFADYYYKPIQTKTPLDPAAYKKIEEGLGFLNTGLEGQKFAAEDSLTIADFSLITTISTYDGLKFNLTPYPNVAQWYERCKKTMPGYDLNVKGVEQFLEKIGPMLPKFP